jgi:protein TonB
VADLISISHLQQPAASLQWHEAVAVIAELAATMSAGGLVHVPAPESVFVGADGSLDVRDGRSLGGPPSQQLASLLGGLLTSARVPPELAQFVADRSAAEAARATVQEFAESLAFFEPPGRREIVKALVERTSSVAVESRTEEALERLAERSRNAEREPVQPKDVGVRSRRRMMLLAGMAAALVATVGAAVALFTTRSERGRVAGSLRAQVKALVDTGLEAVGAATPPASPAPDPPAAAAARPAPRAGRHRPSVRNPEPVQLTVEVRDLAGFPAPETLPPDRPDLHDAPVDDTVYSADADGIEPAVLVRPHLPSRIPSAVRVEELGILELVVNQTGAVDHVRLISDANRYQDRMIVAAAKAWRFQPATKDGAPVRSRVRIRVTL